MIHTSLTPQEIEAYRREYPKDRYCIRHINGEHGQHWSVSNQLWNTLSLSYTESEAYAILALFQKKTANENARCPMNTPTRKELLTALRAVEESITNGDVLFDPDPHWEGEEARYDRAQNALALVSDCLQREGGA